MARKADRYEVAVNDGDSKKLTEGCLADAVEIVDGCLLFLLGGRWHVGYAAGEWSSFWLVTE